MERTTQRYILYGLLIAFIIAFTSYAYAANQMNHRLAELNADQISECTVLSCQTTFFGEIICTEDPLPDSFKPVPAPHTGPGGEG